VAIETEGNETILFVDDEDFIRLVAKDILESKGYRLLEAAHGKEALELYELRGKEIDLVILDISMPGMGGRETYEKLKQHDGDVKVILSTGYPNDSECMDLLTRGVKAFIEKPYRVEDLALVIRKVLDDKAT